MCFERGKHLPNDKKKTDTHDVYDRLGFTRGLDRFRSLELKNKWFGENNRGRQQEEGFVCENEKRSKAK